MCIHENYPEAFESQRGRCKWTIWVCLAKKGCAQVLQLSEEKLSARTQDHCPCDVLSEMNFDGKER